MSTIEYENRLAMLIGSLMGEYGTGAITVHSTGATAELPKGPVAYPIINGAIDEDSMLIVPPNPDTKNGAWPIEQAGTVLSIESLFGGNLGNVDVGTECLWHPPIAGVEASSYLTTAVTGATELETFGALKRVRRFKDFREGTTEEGAFLSQVEIFPGAVLSWTSTAPASGSTSPSLGENPNRVAEGIQLYKHEWLLFLLTSRQDSEGFRRRESAQLRDDVLVLLTDRKAWRGFDLSTPQGIEVLEASHYRMSENLYVDVIRFTNSFALERKEFRTWNPWLKTRLRQRKDQ